MAVVEPLRVFFIPLMSPGHMIPMVDMAKLFSRHGASATIVTTPGNEPLVRPSVAGSSVDLLLLPFPPSAAELLPGGRENLTFMPKSDHARFFDAFFALRPSLEALLRARRPDCIVTDTMYAWTADAAAALGIPRLVFHGHGTFPQCVHDSLHLRGTHKKKSEEESFLVEGIPDRVELRKSEVSSIFQWEAALDFWKEAEEKSFGVVVNSFYALEPEYAELYRRKPGRRAWCVGPVSLANCKGSTSIRSRGGNNNNPEVEHCLERLDSVGTAGSVVYVCFGSLNEFEPEQLDEVASGLEESGYGFVWVVRNSGWAAEEGYEERVKGRGVIIRGWAPQTLILSHPAVGGFVTHCGWNSTLEGVAAGVPMVTWPVEYEQFVNEKLICQVLGVGVGVERGEAGAVVRKEAVAKAVAEAMGGGREGERRREKAREYAAMAAAAVEEGGSSYMDTAGLIQELREFRAQAQSARPN
ncbi:scopoletin glucosyltransferase-like [Iris pallida]|uniref:Glycosyltransferase n=1 Tax=Iris pallida TaxID=29817 RepID=A0AAX6I1J4_IRIPA|nr:scopoletin glucosyltransferase-like [Iris pallida]